MKRKKGLLICFTGIDGSGKTTLAKRLTESLIEKDTHVVYVYGRLKLFLTKPLTFIGNKMFLKNYSITENYVEYSGKKKILFSKHKFILKTYLYVLLFDYLLQLMIKIRIPLLLGKVVICDRYIYDTIITDIAVDMNFSKEEIISLLDKCFLLIPNPDMTFLVDVCEKVAYSRKNDVPDERYLKDRRSIYLQVARHYKFNMTILNGNKKPGEIFVECVGRLKNDLSL
ncbi:MAG TPA: adenylyl-sulfate kinase [Candidatus Methanofastidiosum sp.]|nr:adenylyl-sulfate kinase [Methanofastidiosum sp.]